VVRIHTGGDPERLLAGVRRLDGINDGSVVDGTVLVTARGADGLLPRILQRAEADGFDVSDVSVTEPTLETVFINLTGKELRE
jgi:ABC-2 type transport system ATP-binding protein